MAIYDFSEVDTIQLDKMLYHLQEAIKCGFGIDEDAMAEIISELKKRVIIEGNK